MGTWCQGVDAQRWTVSGQHENKIQQSGHICFWKSMRLCPPTHSTGKTLYGGVRGSGVAPALLAINPASQHQLGQTPFRVHTCIYSSLALPLGGGRGDGSWFCGSWSPHSD